MNFTNTIDMFCLAWTAVSAKRRDKLLTLTFDEGGLYVDPLVQIRGRAALASHIESVTARRGGIRLVRTGAVDHHHDLVRFCCEVIESDGCALGEMQFHAEIRGCTNRLVKVVAFRGPMQTGRPRGTNQNQWAAFLDMR